MFLKAAALILSMGLIACAMLTFRQQRIEAAHELTKAQNRLAELDRQALRLRLEVASRIRLDRIERDLAKFGPLEPMRFDRYETFVQREAEAALSEGLATGLNRAPDTRAAMARE